MKSRDTSDLDYNAFRKKIDTEAFTNQQIASPKLRLELLESFMNRFFKIEEE